MTRSDDLVSKEQRLKLITLAMGGGLLMLGMTGAVVFLMVATVEEPEPPRPAPALAVYQQPEPTPAAAQQPSPSPLEGSDQGGYGRPEPLFPSQAAPSGGPQPQAAPTSPGAGPQRGDLPGRYGNPHATIELVVFNDFECPFCSRLEGTFEALHERYPSQLEVHFRDYPLSMHTHARDAHMAARCAHDQGRFWAMHDQLFANQRALERDDLIGYARALGLNTAPFTRCLEEGHHAVAIDRDIAAAKAASVTGTPATFVNGTLVSGARPADAFIEVIEAAR
jgi:protein-disulfide isomerase